MEYNYKEGFSYPEDFEKAKEALSFLPEEACSVIVTTFFQFMSMGLF